MSPVKDISRKKFRENPNRKPVRDFKIRVWAQFVISKLGSGASSSFVGFQALALTRLVARRVCKRKSLKTALATKLTIRGGAKS